MESCLRSSGLIFLWSSEAGMSFNLQFIMVLLDDRQNSKMAKLQDGSGGKWPRAQNEPSQSGLGSILATEFMSCGQSCQVMFLLRPLFQFWGHTPACAHHSFSTSFSCRPLTFLLPDVAAYKAHTALYIYRYHNTL